MRVRRRVQAPLDRGGIVRDHDRIDRGKILIIVWDLAGIAIANIIRHREAGPTQIDGDSLGGSSNLDFFAFDWTGVQ